MYFKWHKGPNPVKKVPLILRVIFYLIYPARVEIKRVGTTQRTGRKSSDEYVNVSIHCNTVSVEIFYKRATKSSMCLMSRCCYDKLD